MFLDEVPEGARAVVVDVAARGYGLRRRLLEMGLTPGTEVEVVRNERGAVVIRMRGATVAIGKGLARKVVVRVSGGDGAQPPSS